MNIRRLVQKIEEGISLAELTERDRDDLWFIAQIDLSSYESNNCSGDTPVYGGLTLAEIRIARRLSKILPIA